MHGVTERVKRHCAQGPQCALLVVRLAHLLRVREAIRTPDLFWPEKPAVVNVFAEVTEDVRLLQHQAHGIAQDKLVPEPLALLPRRCEYPRNSFAHEASDVVAVDIKLLAGVEK